MADKEPPASAAPKEEPTATAPAAEPSAATTATTTAAAPAAPASPVAAAPVSASSPPKSRSATASPPKSRSATASPRLVEGGEAHDAPIDAEDVIDDGDSAIGESTSTYTTSLASSMVDYPVEYGRRYHAYQHGRYTRPNDELEMDRLLIMHTVITMAVGSLYRAPVDMEKPQRILDIGTGNGVWAIEMADQFPNATIIGNDLSANMPTFVPPNLKFEVDDVENDWVYEQPFTYIFSRYMAASINDWPRLVGRAFENLEPGGWAEFQDFDLTYYSEDDSLKPDDPLMVWIDTMCGAARSMGRDPAPGSQLKGWFEDAGFTNIVHRRYKLPLGPWAKDPHLKQVGLHNYMQVNQGLEGLSMRLYINVLKWTVEEAMVALAEVRKRLQNPNIHPILDFHVVYGQKPE